MFSLDLLRSLSLRSLKNLNLDSVLRVLLEIISVRHTSDRNWNLELIQWWAWKYPSELFLIQLESPCPVYLYFVYLVFLVLKFVCIIEYIQYNAVQALSRVYLSTQYTKTLNTCYLATTLHLYLAQNHCYLTLLISLVPNSQPGSSTWC